MSTTRESVMAPLDHIRGKGATRLLKHHYTHEHLSDHALLKSMQDKLKKNPKTVRLGTLTTRLATLLLLHAAGAGLASPAVLISRPSVRIVEWLPVDNQSVYTLSKGEIRSLELNTSSLAQRLVFVTVSPCSRDFHWALFSGPVGSSDARLSLVKERTGAGGDMSAFSLLVSLHTRFVIQLSSARGGAAAIAVRGEATRPVRLRLRVRPRRRMLANWDPSPIDPQATTYCIVASHKKNYTSLCAAQRDVKSRLIKPVDKPISVDNLSSIDKLNSIDKLSSNDKLSSFDRMSFNKHNATIKLTSFESSSAYDSLSSETFSKENTSKYSSLEMDNKIDVDAFNIYGGHFKTVYRRRKFGRSTKATDGDPIIACVRERTHHVIENLDPSLNYYVSVFGVARDRRAGSLLASAAVRRKSSSARRLRENTPSRAEVRGRTVYYFKASVGEGGGIWMTVTTCGGAVDVEVLVKGKRLHLAKNIEPHSKFFVAAPMSTSTQETSDEGSVQFDSSSEEMKTRYVMKVTPNRTDGNGPVSVEITASTTRWGASTPELDRDGATVRELRPHRSCRSLDVAFLPAAHNTTKVIRYCITARENVTGGSYVCAGSKKSPAKSLCVSHNQTSLTKVIVQKISGLKPGRKYTVQVTASNRGSIVPYNALYTDTPTCKETD